MKKFMMILLAVALAMPLSVLAQAGPGGPQCAGGGHSMMKQGGGHDGAGCCGMRGHGDGCGMQMLLRNAEEIGLTQEQKDKLEKMATEFRMQQIDREAALEKAQVRMQDLMRDDNAPENQVMAQIDELARLKADVRKAQYQHHKQMRAVLTAEQQAKMKKMKQDMQKCCPGHGEGHGMGPCKKGQDQPGQGQGEGPGIGQGPQGHGCNQPCGQFCRK